MYGKLRFTLVENDYYIHMLHPMTKMHYISFFTYETSDSQQFVKLYQEQNSECRFARKGGVKNDRENSSLCNCKIGIVSA